MAIKKVAIATCYNEKNYGSKLQAFATKKILDDLKVENCFLYCSNPIDYMTQPRILYYLKKIQDGDIEMKLGAIKKKIIMKKNPEIYKRIERRNSKFDEFVKSEFVISEQCDGVESLKKVSKQFDAILVGSDQLWSPSGIEHGFYTLEHIEGIKKISYSTSFGVSRLNNSQIKKIKKYLLKFDSIAVRENTGKELIKKYLNIDVPVVLDPTLLLKKEDWEKKLDISMKLIDEDYIFFYFLGNNPEQHKIVKKLKERTGCKIVGVLHLDTYIPADNDIVDQALYEIGPAEFLSLVKNAKYVCTDSFHGTVFSTLFHKQFITFPRNIGQVHSVNSRVYNLLKNTKLESRYYDDSVDIYNQIICSIDYSKTDECLEELRNSSMDYLKGALEYNE